MPAPIDLLYRMSDRDRALPLWGFIHRRFALQANSNNMVSTFADFAALIPDGFIVNITRVTAVASPDPGTRVLMLIVDVVNAQGVGVGTLFEDPIPYWTIAPVNDDEVIVSQPTDLMFDPLQTAIRMRATFAAIAVQTISYNIFGYVIPRGNFARF